jgi:hypothetical protein
MMWPEHQTEFWIQTRKFLTFVSNCVKFVTELVYITTCMFIRVNDCQKSATVEINKNSLDNLPLDIRNWNMSLIWQNITEYYKSRLCIHYMVLETTISISFNLDSQDSQQIQQQ